MENELHKATDLSNWDVLPLSTQVVLFQGEREKKISL
jgi:hypothetical protein